MLKQIINIQTRKKLTIKCKYCRCTMSEVTDSPTISDELRRRMEYHNLMKHSDRFWRDYAK